MQGVLILIKQVEINNVDAIGGTQGRKIIFHDKILRLPVSKGGTKGFRQVEHGPLLEELMRLYLTLDRRLAAILGNG